MARGLGVKLSPGEIEKITEIGVVFNSLSIVIDIVPLFVLVFLQEWKSVNKYFKLDSFALGATLNLMLTSHVLFVIEDGHDHRDVLFVSIVGLSLDATFAFFMLVHRELTTQSGIILPRYTMFFVLVCFLGGSLYVLCGICANYRSVGWVIDTLGILIVGVLNGVAMVPILTCKGLPDESVSFLKGCTSLFNMFDSGFFVFYAAYLGSFGTFLSVVSLINALGALIQFLAVIAPALISLVLKVKVRCLSCAAYCGGFFWGMDTIFRFIREHGRWNE